MSRAQQEAEKDLNEELAKIHQYYAEEMAQRDIDEYVMPVKYRIINKLILVIDEIQDALVDCTDNNDKDKLEYFLCYYAEAYKKYLQYLNM